MPDSTPATHTCPRCGAPVAARAPEGLCPRCVAALNLHADTGITGAADVETQPVPVPEEIAAHFPQLEIIEYLGRGGMGVVYKARQKALGRLVALKLLAPERVGDPAFAERFSHEAKALATLSHPNIVTIYDFGQAGGFYFLLMEFVDGVNLRQAMKAGRFTPEQALAVVPPVCEALQFAHEHGIVHRDIKPENLLMDKEGRVKIADFGIAKMLHAEDSDVGLAESQPAGTPQYMAPEQKDHRRTDHRADIYSLGVVLYEVLTGELPADKLQPPSRKVQIDVRLDEIVLRALEVKPELRFQTAADFRTQVETVAHESGTSRPPQASSGRVLRMVNGVVTTPDRLAATGEQIFLFRRKTQIVLTDREFNFTQDGVPVCVPLSAIRDVSIGRLPRVVNMVGIRIMSVTFDESGARRQFFFFLNDGAWAPPWELNRRVSEWADALSAAVQDATGHAPTRTPADRLGMPPGAPGVKLIMFLPGLIAILCIFAIVWSPPGSFLARFFTIFPVLVFAVGAVVGLLVFALGRRRPSTDDEVSAVENPAGFSRMAIVGAAWFGVALVGILTVAGPIQKGLPWWQTLLSLMILLPTLSAPFGTTILGWVAVSQIRRSAGKLRGLGLAVFDGALFPLLVLDGFIGWLSFFLTRLVVDFHANPSVVGDPRIAPPFLTRLANDLAQQGVSATVLAVATVFVILVVDFLLIRAVWRAMNRPQIPQKPLSAAERQKVWKRFGLIALTFALLLLGAYLVSRGSQPTRPAPLPATKEMTIPQEVVPGFLPARQLILSRSDADADGCLFFKMATGESIRPPFRLTLKPGNAYFAEFTLELEKWIAEHDVDILFKITDAGWQMMTLEMQEDFATQPLMWERVTPEQLRAVFRAKDARGLVRDKVPNARSGGYSSGFSSVDAFRTRRDAIGAYQICGDIESDSGVKGVRLRWKLVDTATGGGVPEVLRAESGRAPAR